MMFSRVAISVPATSANLGPGFDALGMALDLRNHVELSRLTSGIEVEISGEGADRLPHDSSNVTVASALRILEMAGQPPIGWRFKMHNRIPSGSGMGSSAAAIAGGIAAACALLGQWPPDDLALKLAVEIEGHPDNVIPCLLGGLVASHYASPLLIHRSYSLPLLKVIIALPRIEVLTNELRAALPSLIPHRAAAGNVARAVLAVRALVDGDIELLGHVIEDSLHVPYRKPSIPGYDNVVAAGIASGAMAATISGAGPSIIAFADSKHDHIGSEMVAAFREAGVDARYWVLSVSAEGARVESTDD